MQLLPSPAPANTLDMVSPKFQPCRAANLPPRGHAQRPGTPREINRIVTEISGEVAARMRGDNIDFQLNLAAAPQEAPIDDDTLEFVLSGVLVATAREVRVDADARIFIGTSGRSDEITVTVASNGIPSIATVRAIESTDYDGDPTIAHCKRLIESAGGRLALTERDGTLGVEIAIPMQFSTAGDAPRPAAECVPSVSPALAS